MQQELWRGIQAGRMVFNECPADRHEAAGGYGLPACMLG
jgi:hypothetical protein